MSESTSFSRPVNQPQAAAANPNNRIGLDYAAESGAAGLGPPPVPIIDAHAHINGREAVRIYKRAADLYGIQQVWSMTQLEQVQDVREVLGDRIQFIAVPNYMGQDRLHDHGPGHLKRIEQFAALGAKIAKFWAAPRGIDYGREAGDPRLLRLDSPQRLEAMKLAAELGMIFMAHVADPDTWFAAKYADASVYGTKRQQYEPLERLLDQFTQPWIAAHMGGWPEDLEFLDALLARHSNLYLDTSATKWMVRELSRHSRKEMISFLTNWSGRVLFGSDIVTSDDHLVAKHNATEMQAKASSPEGAFDLYAGRYWALRTLWETDYRGESPIADPDLALVEPERFIPDDAPLLVGQSLPAALLTTLYREAAAGLVNL
jgi:hypothetical protein